MVCKDIDDHIENHSDEELQSMMDGETEENNSNTDDENNNNMKSDNEDDDEDEDDDDEDEKKDTNNNAIPVTILSGFLGAGKTTLLKHILECKDHKLKIAVIVNDMAEINIDGNTIRQVQKEVITLQNGCICCTLRGDLIKEINNIVKGVDGNNTKFDYIIIESTGIAEPQQVAESFVIDPDTEIIAEKDEQMLWNIARLDTCVTVIDVKDFPNHIITLQRFQDKFNDGLNVIDADDKEEGLKSISHLLMEQVEFANVILLNKIDLISHAELESTTLLIKSLNPNAIILSTQHGIIDPSKILNTKLFNMDEAKQSAGWLVSLGTSGSLEHSIVSESEEYGVTSFVYRARKPFHPQRLHTFINHIFWYTNDWMNHENEKSNEDNKLVTMKSKYGHILRSKGFCWIAGRDSHTAGWAQSGRLFNIEPMIPWYVTQSEDDWETEEGENDYNLIKSKFYGEHGDRRQEIVIIGIQLNKDTIIESLNQCLCNDDDMKHYMYKSNKYYDPLPSWTFHYVEPIIIANIIRPGQAHKFHIHDNVQVTFSNIALHTTLDNDDSNIAVTVWIDFIMPDNNKCINSILLATLRSGIYEQHSMSLTMAGMSLNEDSGNNSVHDGPMIMRVECKNKNSDGIDLSKIEVHILGSVSFLPAGDENYDDEDEEAEEEEDDHCELDHDHHDDKKMKKRKTTTNTTTTTTTMEAE